MHNVPSFPTFRPLELSDCEWYNAYYKQFPPYADFSFGNFIIWLNQFDDLQISNLHNNIVIKCTTLFMAKRQMLTFLGENKVKETLHELLEYQLAQGLPQELLGVPEVVISALGNDAKEFSIEDDRDDYEYMLDVHRLAALSGSEFRRIRREVSTFTRSWGEKVHIKELDIGDRANCDYLYQELHSWEKAFSTNDTAHQEAQVIDRTLFYGKYLDYKNFSVYVGDDLAGFILYQPLPHKTCVVVNHIKASYKYRYTFDYMFISFAKMLLKRGVTLINFEQDLGIPGLREHKEGLKPIYFLCKFTVRLRG